MQKNNKQNIRIDGVNVTLNNVADLINGDIIKNLSVIPWTALLNNANLLNAPTFGGEYAINHKAVESIIKQIVGDSVKVAVIECMQKDLKKYLLPTLFLCNENELQRCLEFLDDLKEDISNYPYYDLQAVKSREKKTKEPLPLPKELDNPTFKANLKKAIKAGFVEETAEGYKWSGQKNELAVFADEVSKKLNLSNRESNGKKQTSWKPFEILFNISNLRGAYNDIQKTGVPPKREKNIIQIVNG